MRKGTFAIGIVTTWFLIFGFWLFAPAARAGLYDDVRAIVEREVDRYHVEDDVKEFVAQTLRATKPLWSETEVGDVDLALRGDVATLCYNRKISRQEDCTAYIQAVTTLARREQELRAFGRQLQALAARDELPIEGLRQSTTDIALHQAAILNVWRAGRGTAPANAVNMGTPVFRGLGLDEGALDAPIANLRSALEALPAEQFTAAVHRYRHGVRHATDDRKAFFPAPTIDKALKDSERQYLLGSWGTVEAALNDIWVQLRSASEEMNLQSGEYATLLATDPAMRAKLPKNVLLWGVVDGNAAQGYPLGDVGLLWQFPMETVLPSLIKQSGGAIPGGAFPPNAEDGQGLCGHPLARLGYLCRPLSGATANPARARKEQDCQEYPADNGAVITLTSCTQQWTEDEYRLARTLAGPDVCEETVWYDEDPPEEAFQCALPGAYCSTACLSESGVPDPDVEWHTYGKASDGAIRICLQADRNEKKDLPQRYNYAVALVVADAFCALPPEGNPFGNPDVDCCRLVGEGYRAACVLMAQDGVFSGSSKSSGSIPLNVQTCTETLTEDACEAIAQVSCPTSRDYSSAGEHAFVEALYDAAWKAVGPETCADVVNPVATDPRLAAMRNAAHRRDDISRPGRQIAYRNSIGNHLCAVGAYLEELWERRQRTGGNVPFTIFDRKSPWQTSGLADPPATDVMAAVLQPLTSAAQFGGILRPYRPAQLARAFDIELCQKSGLPPRVPPERCLLEQRRFSIPLQQFLGTFDRSQAEKESERQAIRFAQEGSAAVGTRIGNEQYAQYLRTGTRVLTDMLGSATDILGRLRLQSSPGQMCPSFPIPPFSGGSSLSVPAMRALSTAPTR